MSNRIKLAALTALIGALAGGAIAWFTTASWEASGSVEVRPQGSVDGTRHWVREATAQVLSRASLSELIQRPAFDLYRSERTRLPLEDVLATMKESLRMEPVDSAGGLDVRCSFVYPDPARAQAVLAELESHFAAQLPGIAEREGSRATATVHAGESRRASGPNESIAFGAAVGAMAGVALVLFRGRSRRWYLTVLGLALGAGAASEAAASVLEVMYPADVQLGVLGSAAGAAAGMFWMERRSVGRAGKLAAAAIAGAAVGFALAFALPQVYESRASLQVSAGGGSGEVGQASERVGKVQEQLLSRFKLAEIIQRPSLDLYREQRQRQPMESVVQTMRDNLRFEPTFHGGPEASIYIAFRYSDRFKAQAVVREMVSGLMERWFQTARAAGQEPYAPGSLRLEIIDGPSRPQNAVAPNKLLMMAAGAGIGILLPLLFWLAERQPRSRRRSVLRGALGAGALAGLLAGVVALALPVRYGSTALLRVTSQSGEARGRRAAELQNRLGEVLGSAGLIELIQKPGLDLYARERKEMPVKDVVQRLRTRDLKVETVSVSAQGYTESLRIVFEYPDGEKAGRFVQALVSALVEPRPGSDPPAEMPGARAYVELVDPPSLPEVPTVPERRSIAAGGLALGLLLATAWFLVGRQERTAESFIS